MATYQDIEERSSLWGASAAAAPIIGFGIGMRNHWQDLATAVKRPLYDYTSAAKRVRELGSLVEPAVTSEIRPLEYFGNMITGSANHGEMKHDIARAAYESIMAGNKPTAHKQAYAAFQGILANSSTPLEAYGQAAKTIGAYGGNANLFEKEIEKITRGNVYNKEFGATIISQAILPSRPDRVDLRSLSSGERAAYEKIQASLKEILGEKSIGKSSLVSVGGVRMMRTNVKGSSARIDLPLGETDILPLGKNFEQRYVLRKGYDLSRGSTKGLEAIGYAESYLSALRAEKDKARSAKHAVINTNARLIDNLNANEAGKRLAIWQHPEEFLTSGGLAKRKLIPLQSVYSGKNMTPDVLDEALASGLFGGTSQGAIGSGTLYRQDVRRMLYGNALGEMFPTSQMPLRFLREEWGLSAEAKALASGDRFRFSGSLGKYMHRLERPFVGPEYNRLMGIETELGDWASNETQKALSFSGREAHVAPQLLTFYAKPGAGGFESAAAREALAKEMGLISTKVSGTMEFERVVSKQIRYAPGLDINQAVQEVIEANRNGLQIGQSIKLSSPVPLNQGQMIGIGAEGRAVRGGGVEGITQEIIGARPVKKDVVAVYLREKYRMQEGMIGKMFGDATKNMMKAQDQRVINEMIGAVAAGAKTAIGGNTVNAFMSAERLAKTPYALFAQQMSAMSLFAAEGLDNFDINKADVWRKASPAARGFLSNQVNYLGLNEAAASAGQVSTEELQYILQKRIVGGARILGLMGEEHAPSIFGMIPQAQLARMAEEGLLSEAETKMISGSKGVYGLESMFLGDLPMEGGAGGRMKMDPAGIRLLAQKSYAGDATLGSDLAADIVTRFEKPKGLLAAQRMQESLVGMGPGKLEALLGPEAVAINKAGPVGEAGQWLDLGKGVEAFGGASRIYRPGMSEMSAMLPVSAKGEVFQSELSKAFGELQAAAGGETESIEAAAKNLRDVGFREYANLSSASSRVYGTRQLTAERMSQEMTERMGGAAGISRRTGEEMFDELIERSSAADQEGLRAMRERFVAGEDIGGMLGRHPHVSPESIQASRFRMMREAKDYMIYTPREMGMVGDVLTDLSQDVGMKADYDKDMLTASFIKNKDLESRVSRLTTNEIQENYNKYLANHYMLDRAIKEKEVPGATLRGLAAEQAEARTAAYGKMAAGETNIALQKMKLAVSANKPEHYNELAAMFWHIEERASINAKHGMVAGADLYKRLGAAVETADEDALAGVFRDVFGEGRELSTELKGKSYSLDYSPTKAARTSVEALRASQREVELSHELAAASKGSRQLTRERMAEHLAFSREGLSLDVGQRMVRGIEEGEGNILSMASRRIKGLTNKASQVASVMSRAKKPLVLGALAGAAIMMSAPAVSGSLKNPNKEGPAGGHNVDMMNSMPPSGPGMSIPKARIQRSPRTYSLPSSRMTGSYDSRDLDKDYNGAMRYASSMNSSSVNARMHVNDNRSAMDPRMLANKIHEQM